MKLSRSMEQRLLWGALPILLLIAFAIYKKKVPSEREIYREPAIAGPHLANEEFKKQWELHAEAIDSALALGEDGTVYASTIDGSLYAVNPSGNLHWKTTIGPTHEAPTIASDGTIYVANANQTFYAINRDGSIKWTRDSGPYADKSSPWRAGALDDEKFYTIWRGSLRAVNQQNGTIAWSSGWGYEQAGSASLRPDGTLVFMGPGWLHAAGDDGKILWSYPPPDPLETPIQLPLPQGWKPPEGRFFLDSGIAVDKDGTVYAAAAGSKLISIAPDGTLRWEVDTHRNTTNYATPLIAADGTIYDFCGDGAIYAMNADGSQKWLLETGSIIAATPVLAADGTLLVVARDSLLAVSAEGKILGKTGFRVPGHASPTLAPDGTFYVVSSTGTLAAFSTRHGGLMDSAWPKFQHDLSNTGRARSF